MKKDRKKKVPKILIGTHILASCLSCSSLYEETALIIMKESAKIAMNPSAKRSDVLLKNRIIESIAIETQKQKPPQLRGFLMAELGFRDYKLVGNCPVT